ncbi:uncharacterized protein VTP21DRAFT_4349 [Calcarisporiella thermophila]|uniref:uncharacterized protein n=1 Tax=Calcarisporiella thermophila TaxID=911321 RepID=UPI003744411D
MSRFAFAALLVLLFTLSLAKEVDVQVGPRPFTFEPSTLNVDVGDKIIFRFINGQHSVTQSESLDSCSPKLKGFDSESTGPGKTFNITFKKPGKYWFFCKVGNHCQNGMRGTVIVGGAQAGPGNTTVVNSNSPLSSTVSAIAPSNAASDSSAVAAPSVPASPNQLPSGVPRAITPSVVPTASAGAASAAAVNSNAASGPQRTFAALMVVFATCLFATFF